MTIMIAGGMTFAVPGMVPAAHAANANLFVSAENSQFDNYMSGPQVIEIVIIDSDINDTNESKGEPDVTINGKKIRMVQAVDGNWYGYFADVTQAITADATTTTANIGLDFGAFCDNTSDISAAGTPVVNVLQTDGIAIGSVNGAALQGAAITPATLTSGGATCPFGYGPGDTQNVLRQEKQVNVNLGTGGVGGPDQIGQIGVDVDIWPFIQLYNLSVGGNVEIIYHKGGGPQTTTLTFDTVEAFAGLELDRTVYPQGSEVHVTITDLWLNIDPTDEDSWTFGTFGTASTNYQVFDENGLNAGDVPSNTGGNLLTAALGALMCEDNCILLVNPDQQGQGNVITLQDTGDSVLTNVDGPDM